MSLIFLLLAVSSWLVSYADAHLYEQAIEHGAEKADLATQFRAAIYLDRLYSSASDGSFLTQLVPIL